MSNYKVIIGSGYGDEGKGISTARMCKDLNDALVVRFNGGSQAGHTVEWDDSRHVFSHFGSGTPLGVPTYLAKQFVCNPIMFRTEYEELKKKGCTPKVFVDPNCLVTTPFDVAINRAMEESRGALKHGSVGVGFGETIQRSTVDNQVFSLTVSDLFDQRNLYKKLKWIAEHYVPARLGAFSKILNEEVLEETIKDFMVDCLFFRDHVLEIEYDLVLTKALVFEGAQGLLLDQDYGVFPYVTRSNTGLKNVVELVGDVPLDVYYVMRTYTTRHGVGPLPHECEKPYPHIEDKTNIPNDWQDSLRFSYLNLDSLIDVIGRDINTYVKSNTSANIIITCCDQVGTTIKVILDGKVKEMTLYQLEKFWKSRGFNEVIRQSSPKI